MTHTLQMTTKGVMSREGSDIQLLDSSKWDEAHV